MDDLSSLIEPATDEHIGDLDDLSTLVGKPAQSQEPMDDLSSLIEPATDEHMGDFNDLYTGEKSGQVSPEIDTQVKETHSIKPDILPDQDKGKYKAAVMKIIIELKGQGLTAQQTTDRLNHDDVTTLSGKPAWGLKAIDKIYGFIDSTK